MERWSICSARLEPGGSSQGLLGSFLMQILLLGRLDGGEPLYELKPGTDVHDH